MDTKPHRLCKRAVMLCKDPTFRLFLDRRTSAKSGFHTPDGTHTEQCARDWILKACGELESRTQIDTNPKARQSFGKIINSYNKWLRR